MALKRIFTVYQTMRSLVSRYTNFTIILPLFYPHFTTFPMTPETLDGEIKLRVVT